MKKQNKKPIPATKENGWWGCKKDVFKNWCQDNNIEWNSGTKELYFTCLTTFKERSVTRPYTSLYYKFRFKDEDLSRKLSQRHTAGIVIFRKGLENQDFFTQYYAAKSVSMLYNKLQRSLVF